MSNEKFSLGDKKLGKVKKVIKSSGMLELTSGEKIPPFPNVEVGNTIEIRDKRYYVVGKGTAGAGKNDTDASDTKDEATLKKENTTLKKELKVQMERLDKLEEKFGEKGEKNAS